MENAALRAVEKLRLEQLATEAHHDPLTGLANRRRLIEELEATVYGAERPHVRRPHARPGPVQGDQRQLRAQRRRRPALPRRTAAPAGAGARRPAGPDGRRRVRRPAARRRRRPRPRGGRPSWVPCCATRSSWTACRCTSTPASASRSAPTTAGTARCCSPAPTPPCTWPSGAGTGYDVWAPDGTAATRDRLETLEQLRTALDDDQLDVHYQPKLDLRTGRVIGVEALVRWNHPDRGLLYPDVFLPLAEQAGLMRRLALRVLERSLRDLQEWRATGAGALRGGQPLGLQPAGRRPARAGRDAARQLRRAGRGADPGDHRGRPHGRRGAQPAGDGRAAAARRPAVDRRLRHRLLVAVLPARPARSTSSSSTAASSAT